MKPTVKVVSKEEAEEADLIVCAPWENCVYFEDDVKTSCADCGRAIGHRPHAPKKPPKICLECMMRRGAH